MRGYNIEPPRMTEAQFNELRQYWSADYQHLPHTTQVRLRNLRHNRAISRLRYDSETDRYCVCTNADLMGV